LAAVTAATLAAAVPLILRLDTHVRGLPTFLILATCAAIAQLFVVRTNREDAYHTAIVFLIAGALLLPPELVALMGVVQHVPEWLKRRTSWHVPTFDICTSTLSALAASFAARFLLDDVDTRWALAALVAALVFVALNDALLAGMLYLSRG